MKKYIALLSIATIITCLNGCTSLAEESYAQAEDNLNAKVAKEEAKTENQVAPKKLISVDGITGLIAPAKEFAVLPPVGKKPDLLYEKVKASVVKALEAQGYKETAPESAKTVVVFSYASNSREGRITLAAYDADYMRSVKDKADAYKIQAKTLVYYIFAEPKPFRDAFPEVLDTTSSLLLKDVSPTAYFKDE